MTFTDYVTTSEYRYLSTTQALMDPGSDGSGDALSSSLMIGHFHYDYPAHFLQVRYNYSLAYSEINTYLLFPSNWTMEDDVIFEFEAFEQNFTEVYLFLTPYDSTRGFTGIDVREVPVLPPEVVEKYPNYSSFNRIGVTLGRNAIYQYI